MKKIVCSLVFIGSFLLTYKSQAQDIITQKNFISYNILGTASFLGVTYERMLTDKFAAEIGIGIISAGAGMTYYPGRIKEGDVSFYTGLKFSSPNIISVVFLLDDSTEPILYIPIGLVYATSGGFSIGIDAGPNLIGDYSAWGNIRIGYRF
jgi:hypothetical protein